MIPNIIKMLNFVEPQTNGFCCLGWCVDCLHTLAEMSKGMKNIFGVQRSAHGYARPFVLNWISKPKNSTVVPSCAKTLKLQLTFFLKHHIRNTAREHGPKAELHHIVKKKRRKPDCLLRN